MKILEDPWTLQKTRGRQPDAMEIVRNLQARIEVKMEVMEEEQHEHARRHAQLQSVLETKMKEATELRGRLDDIALAFNARSVVKRSAKEVCRSAGTPTATGLLVGLVWWTHVQSVVSPSHLESSSLGHCQTSEGFSSRSQQPLMWSKGKAWH